MDKALLLLKDGVAYFYVYLEIQLFFSIQRVLIPWSLMDIGIHRCSSDLSKIS